MRYNRESNQMFTMNIGRSKYSPGITQAVGIDRGPFNAIIRSRPDDTCWSFSQFSTSSFQWQATLIDLWAGPGRRLVLVLLLEEEATNFVTKRQGRGAERWRKPSLRRRRFCSFLFRLLLPWQPINTSASPTQRHRQLRRALSVLGPHMQTRKSDSIQPTYKPPPSSPPTVHFPTHSDTRHPFISATNKARSNKRPTEKY